MEEKFTNVELELETTEIELNIMHNNKYNNKYKYNYPLHELELRIETYEPINPKPKIFEQNSPFTVQCQIMLQDKTNGMKISSKIETKEISIFIIININVHLQIVIVLADLVQQS